MNAHLPAALFAAAALSAGAATSLPVACNLHALDSAERARHAVLIGKLRAAAAESRPIANGLSVRLDPTKITLAEVGEWQGLEHRCCPFLRFELTVEPGAAGPVWLTLTGPAGTQELLANGLTG